MAQATLLGVLSAAPVIVELSGAEAHGSIAGAGSPHGEQGFAAVLHALHTASVVDSGQQQLLQGKQAAHVVKGNSFVSSQTQEDAAAQPKNTRLWTMNDADAKPQAQTPSLTGENAANSVPGVKQGVQAADKQPSLPSNFLLQTPQQYAPSATAVHTEHPGVPTDAVVTAPQTNASANKQGNPASTALAASATAMMQKPAPSGISPTHQLRDDTYDAVASVPGVSALSPNESLASTLAPADVNNAAAGLSPSVVDLTAKMTTPAQPVLAPAKHGNATPEAPEPPAPSTGIVAKQDSPADPLPPSRSSLSPKPQPAVPRVHGKDRADEQLLSVHPMLAGTALAEPLPQAVPAQTTPVPLSSTQAAVPMPVSGSTAGKPGVAAAARAASLPGKSTPALNADVVFDADGPSITVAGPHGVSDTPNAKTDSPQELPKGTAHTSFAEALSTVAVEGSAKTHAEGATYTQSVISTPSHRATDTEASGINAATRVSAALEPQTSVAASTTPVRKLEFSMQDPVLGTVGVQAEMRGGVVHASLTGTAEAVGASLSSLHHYLNDQQVAVNSLTFHSSADRSNGTQFANSTSDGTGSDGGASASFSADRQSRGNTRQDAESPFDAADNNTRVSTAKQPISSLYGGAPAVVSDGSTLSIHI